MIPISIYTYIHMRIPCRGTAQSKINTHLLLSHVSTIQKSHPNKVHIDQKNPQICKMTIPFSLKVSQVGLQVLK